MDRHFRVVLLSRIDLERGAVAHSLMTRSEHEALRVEDRKARKAYEEERHERLRADRQRTVDFISQQNMITRQLHQVASHRLIAALPLCCPCLPC